MKWIERAVVIVDLADRMIRQGNWCGEKHIQWAAYYLQELLGVPLGYRFILYYRNPYSFDLQHELSDFMARFLLELVPRRTPYSPSIRPTDNALDLLKNYPVTLGKYSECLRFVSEALGPKGAVELDPLAAALYVTREMDTDEREVRARRVMELRPHVTRERALKAVDELDVLRQEAQKVAVIEDAAMSAPVAVSA